MSFGWQLKKSTISFGSLERIVLAGDDLASPNSNATRDVRAGANGLIVHDTYTAVNFNFVTTSASVSVSVTLTGGPAYKVIVYNSSTTSAIYVNFDATAVLPVAATTAGSFRVPPDSYYTEFFLTTVVHVISTAASVDARITSFA